MRLHISVVNKLLYLFQNYGGHENESRLRSKIEQLDFTPYERKSTPDQEIILVLTEDFVKQLSGGGQR